MFIKTNIAMCSNKLLCILLFVILTDYVHSQDANMNSLDSFSAKFITAIRANANQRVYLTTDRSVYKAGEYVWFKAFLLNAVSQKISTKSRYLFVDVVNDKDSILNRVILNTADKQLNSRIQFPDSLPTGYYWLRAYTRQMAETDTNDICVKTLYVAGMLNNPVKPRKNANGDDAPVISFYPEGGNLITGINSVMALQLKLTDGEPLSTQGYLKDNHDDTVITQFATNAYGFGKFEFEPSGYRQYKAVINWKGKDISYPLPPFNFYAGQLSVTKPAGDYKLRILLGDSIYTDKAPTYILGISKDSLVFAGIGKGLYETFIDGQKLPAGIVDFYLFDKNFKQISERSIYVTKNDVLVNISTDKNIYSAHDKIALNVSITDEGQHPVPALVAVSVSDSLFSQKQQQCNFNNASPDVNAIDNLFLATNSCFTEDDMDLIMLARNNTYKTSFDAASAPATDNDSLLYIKGVVLSEKNNSPENKVVSIFSNSGNSFFATDTTDNTGRFCFPFDGYPDSTKFIIEVKNLNGVTQNNPVRLDAFNYPKLKTPVSLKQYFIAEPGQIRQRFNTYYENQWNENVKQLPPVTVNDQITTADYDVSKRVSPNSSILTSKDLDGKMSVDNAILKISGLQVLDGYLVMHGLTALHGPGPSSEPIVLVEGAQAAISADGIGTSSPVLSFLRSLNPKDIDFIEVLKDGNASSYGVRGANGVILINLVNKEKDYYGTDKKNMNVFYAEGISKPVLFPDISYEKKNKKNTPPPEDNRSTLLWNGNLLTGDVSTSTLNFYASDIPATYNVTLTGITSRGDIIYKTINFKSK